MRGLLAAGLALGVLGASGCGPQGQMEARQQVQGIRQEVNEATAQARQAAADATLEGKVKTALSTRKGIDASHIDVEAKGSTVVLKGDVDSQAAAELAERVAMETEGVQTVDNQLTLRVPAKQTMEVTPGTTASGGAQTAPTAPATPTGPEGSTAPGLAPGVRDH